MSFRINEKFGIIDPESNPVAPGGLIARVEVEAGEIVEREVAGLII